jgi:hypothetical protein
MALCQHQLAPFQSGQLALNGTASNVCQFYQLGDEEAPFRLPK